MDKTALKKFSIMARNALIRSVTDRCGLIGIREDGIQNPLPNSTKDIQFFDAGTGAPSSISGNQIEKRNALVHAIREKERDSDYKTAYQYIVEQVAYTWFNRLIAIRFMEVNEYLPSRIRVLSSEQEGKLEPDILSTPFDADFDFSEQERDTIIQLKDRGQKEDMDALFRMLFVKQCDALHENLPELFQKVDGSDYTELLLNISFTDREGVVYHLVNDIPEDNFDVSKEGQVEIIGWMYQYYISEKHEEVINVLGKTAIKKEDIPAATQLFTTDWVVRYMVDNSLGRYWIERHPESNLANKLNFFLSPKDGKMTYINEKIEPEDLTFFDPCMGSGHILVYAFDVLMEIYREAGYTDRDAAISILENNLFGLDIDQRAYQLAYFAVMMKARSYDRRLFSRGIQCHLVAIEESNGIDRFDQGNVTPDEEQNKIGEYLIEVFRHAKEIGSLQTVKPLDYDRFRAYLDSREIIGQLNFESTTWLTRTVPVLRNLIRQARILSSKYSVVCTNPPYLNKMEGHLKDFVVDNYKAFSGDLFSVFMYRNFGFCKPEGYSAFMTPNVWMFIKSYEKLREYLITQKGVCSLVQMAKGAFYKEATVDVCSFVLCNQTEREKGTYIRLEDFKGSMDVQKEHFLIEIHNPDESPHIFRRAIHDFLDIEGMPFAYWISNKTKAAFRLKTTIGTVCTPKQGMATADNNRFLRLWYEVNIDKIGFGITSTHEAKESGKKWFPYNKGGAFRRWYGNRDYVVNWENDGAEIKSFTDDNGKLRSRPQNLQYFFKPAITWSDTTSASFSGRYAEKGFIFDIKGSSGFPKEEDLYYILGLLNSSVSQAFIKILNPTITTQVGDMSRIPVALDAKNRPNIEARVGENIAAAKADWDSDETSWDFKIHHLLKYGVDTIEEAYKVWEKECQDRYDLVKRNEEYINKQFIEIYGLNEELTDDVPDDAITVRKAEKKESVVSLLSYSVGCMFGRYSLDRTGIVADGSKRDNNKNIAFAVDNCIPITDEEYFNDDIIVLLCSWLRIAFGENTLEENLTYIADVLGKKGTSSREKIRNYFLNDFYSDHCNAYSITGSGKRPIYWLLDSGKQNGFKALIYMHRYDENTTGRIRADYLFKMQRAYENELKRVQDIIDGSSNSREVAQAEKRKEKLTKQLKETRDYDQKLAHLALARIPIDLDDGVKVNYEKIQTTPDGKKLDILAKI
jgi:hypothetical protein